MAKFGDHLWKIDFFWRYIRIKLKCNKLLFCKLNKSNSVTLIYIMRTTETWVDFNYISSWCCRWIRLIRQSLGIPMDCYNLLGCIYKNHIKRNISFMHPEWLHLLNWKDKKHTFLIIHMLSEHQSKLSGLVIICDFNIYFSFCIANWIGKYELPIFLKYVCSI